MSSYLKRFLEVEGQAAKANKRTMGANCLRAIELEMKRAMARLFLVVESA